MLEKTIDSINCQCNFYSWKFPEFWVIISIFYWKKKVFLLAVGKLFYLVGDCLGDLARLWTFLRSDCLASDHFAQWEILTFFCQNSIIFDLRFFKKMQEFIYFFFFSFLFVIRKLQWILCDNVLNLWINYRLYNSRNS